MSEPDLSFNEYPGAVEERAALPAGCNAPSRNR